MASSTSSGSTLLFTSCSEGDDFNHHHQGTDVDLTANPADQRRQKRMLSNRESARRSRMRKQKHLDDLTAEVIRLRIEKDRLLATLKNATQQYHALESDNSVMRAQAAELATRLESLSEILNYMDVEQQQCFAYGDDYSVISSSSHDDVKPRAGAADQGFTPCPWIWNWNTQQLQPSIMGIVSAAAAAAGAGAPPAFPMATADMLLY